MEIYILSLAYARQLLLKKEPSIGCLRSTVPFKEGAKSQFPFKTVPFWGLPLR